MPCNAVLVNYTHSFRQTHHFLPRLVHINSGALCSRTNFMGAGEMRLLMSIYWLRYWGAPLKLPVEPRSRMVGPILFVRWFSPSSVDVAPGGIAKKEITQKQIGQNQKSAPPQKRACAFSRAEPPPELAGLKKLRNEGENKETKEKEST